MSLLSSSPRTRVCGSVNADAFAIPDDIAKIHKFTKKRDLEVTVFSLFRAAWVFTGVVLAATLLTAASSQSYADTGSVRLRITKVGFIVGVGGGSGVLTFHGRHYRLSVGGISAGTIGAAGADLVGVASNLRTPADIEGAYSAISAGVSVAGGAKVATLQNAKGVVLQLRGRQVGFEASLAVSGMTISLQ